MKITEADREFGRSIADLAANLVGEVGDPLQWVADMVALKGPPEQAKELILELRGVLRLVLDGDQQPDEALRQRCAKVYLDWLTEPVNGRPPGETGPMKSRDEDARSQGQELLRLIRDLLPPSDELNVLEDPRSETVLLRDDLDVLFKISYECFDWAGKDGGGIQRIADMLRGELDLKERFEERSGWWLSKCREELWKLVPLAE